MKTTTKLGDNKDLDHKDGYSSIDEENEDCLIGSLVSSPIECLPKLIALKGKF